MLIPNQLITHFEIRGLHGDRDFILDFDSSIKILVGENGAGKTTILNSLFYLLSSKWNKLDSLEFDSIYIKFMNNQDLTLNKKELRIDLHRIQYYPTVSDSLKFISEDQLYELVDLANRTSYYEFRDLNITKLVLDDSDINVNLKEVHNVLREAYNHEYKYDTGKLKECSSQLKELFPYKILYFPTYRRVEQDLHSLGYTKTKLNVDEQLIHFGMQDVQNRFDRITDKIRDSSVESYSTISQKMIKDLVNVKIAQPARRCLVNK